MEPEFKPKISYRVSNIYIDKSFMKKPTPWEYLADWAMSDRGPEHTIHYFEDKMKEHWPGNYRITTTKINDSRGGYIVKWVLVFDDPAEETMFKLRWA